MSISTVQQVQDAFLEALTRDGIIPTLLGIGTWYDRAAEAEIALELERSLGEFSADPEARELAVLDYLLPDASSVSNYSTSAGHNLFRQSCVAARARLLNDARTGTAGRTGRRERWDEIRTRLLSEKAAS